MKSSTRDLLIVPRKGKLNKKRRYYNLRNAIRHAMADVVAQDSTLTIYDTQYGRDIAQVSCNPHGINILVVASNRVFSRLWSR
jgi:hypothetical protein